MKDKSTKKDFGAIPTPQPVVKHIIDLVLEYQSYKNKKVLVLDHSVGDGRFLSQYYYSYKNKFKNRDIRKSLFLFGLDIDPKAIELALARMKRINCNISLKVGNALVGYLKQSSDYKAYWSKEELDKSYVKSKKIKHPIILNEILPFHWFREWPEFFSNDGFDLIIGNPPYGVSYSHAEKKLYRTLYRAIDPEIESYIMFIERSVHLLREGGLLGVIIPSNIATNYRYCNIRKFLLNNVKILNIISFNKQIFPNIHVESLILILKKCSNPLNRTKNSIKFELISYEYSRDIHRTLKENVIQKDLDNNSYKMLIPKPENDISKILEKIEENSIPLKNLVDISRGIELGYKSSRTSRIKSGSEFVPLIAGRSVRKFRLKKNCRYILFDSDNKSVFKDKNKYIKPQKLFLRRIGHDLICAYDPNKIFCVCDVYMIVPNIIRSSNDIFYFEALLNSKLMSFYFKHKFTTIKRIFPKIPINFLRKLPIKIPNNPKRIYELVEYFHNIPWNKTDTNSDLMNYIKELNQEIYSVYGLTLEEQNTIEDIFSDFSL